MTGFAGAGAEIRQNPTINKCLVCCVGLKHALESELSSLDFVVNSFFMKMFRTNNMDIVRDMQFLFGF